MIQIPVFAGLGLLTVAAVAASEAAPSAARPRATEGPAGLIAPGRATAVATVVAGLAFVAVGGFGLKVGDPLLGSAFLAIGLAIAGFMAPSLTDLHAVRWNADGVEGPSSLFGLTLGLRRTRIAWTDIARAGDTATGYWYIETADGRRVYWSYLYRDWRSFRDQLRRQKPNLELPQG